MKSKQLCVKILEENMSYEEIVSLCEQNNINIKELLDLLKKYVDNMTPIEKRYYNGLLSTKELEERKLPFYNPILLQKGIYSYFIWSNDNEKNIMAKYIYGYCCTIGREIGCEELSQKYNLPISRLLELHDYYKEQLKAEENIPKPYYVPSKIDVFFDKLFEMVRTNNKSNFYDELIKIIKDNNFEKSQITYALLGYLTRNKISMNCYDKVKKIINVCFNYIKKDLKDNNNIEEIKTAVFIINTFIESELDLEEFCEINSISKTKMNNSITIIENNNKELYLLFKKVYEIRKKIKEEYIKSELNKLYEYIVNGIVVNGILREFTIIDYFTNIKLNFKKLPTYLKLLDSKEVYGVISRFKNENIKYIYNINAIAKGMIDTDFSIKDNSGIIVSISMEERIMVIEYIKSIGIPINEYTIYCAFKLYINKALYEEKELDNNLNKTC